ncbi:Telomere repeat-binding protein [Thalictrum thalictroides]|uniref:Telomere repeat-binding protein n=1 Tax=Thalictrum thalictroides TaxID=46969 RepID=A0A7J6VVS1_THATH|nr:Telomere repeat-binding protein [Thalictrum thalictroides]
MVLHRRLEYGFNGYQVPSFPRASRSARGRSMFKTKAEDNQLCAFELLATVAGKLLQEGGSSQSPSHIEDERVQPSIHGLVRQEQREEEPCDPEVCDKSVSFSDLSLHGNDRNKYLKITPDPKHEVALAHSSIRPNSSFLEKFDHAVVVTGETRKEFVDFLSKTEGSPGNGKSCGNVLNGIERKVEYDSEKISSVINGTFPDIRNSEYPMEKDVEPRVCLGSNIEVPHTSFLPFKTNVKLVSKDDDENFSGCAHPCTGNLKAFRPSLRIGDRRIRRLLASKYWKIAPKLNDRKLHKSDMWHAFRNTKASYSRQRSQRNFAYRRKLFDRLLSKSVEGAHNKAISSKKSIIEDAIGSASQASLVASQESPYCSRDSRVKLSIKSFRVPELFIEIPETATVGSLKRTVREAVTAILAGGLHVGVVLQGKKVRDDNKTLLQSGISHDDKVDALGFLLEPNPSPASASAPQPMFHEDSPLYVTCDIPQHLARYPKTPVGDPVPLVASPDRTLTNEGTSIDNILDAVPSPIDTTAVKTAQDCRALVATPTSVEPLAAIPLHRKSRQSKLAQRRIRRPFSVSEVEALVQAVEKLGTGRWRDVKVHAFDNARHRTYVDLKDKWKTLVHTAKISPQQRRGETVPQELLNRVLAAHAHWSEQQAMLQIKQQNETSLVFTSNLIAD